MYFLHIQYLSRYMGIRIIGSDLKIPSNNASMDVPTYIGRY